MPLKIQKVTVRPDPSEAVRWNGTLEGMAEIGRFLKALAPDLHVFIYFHTPVELGDGAVSDHTFRLHIGLTHLRVPQNLVLSSGDYLIVPNEPNPVLTKCSALEFAELWEVYGDE